MTPEKKAKELWYEFYHQIEHTLSEEYSEHENFICKQCALIVVDELIKENYPQDIPRCEYWNEVKQEIQKL